jgi:hypothetical protein
MPLDAEAFEKELRGALRREPPPADFAKRLKARLPVPIPIWRRPALWALAAALLLATLIPLGMSEYRHRQRERALEARRQLDIALRITSVKLRQARERVQRSTSRHTS